MCRLIDAQANDFLSIYYGFLFLSRHQVIIMATANNIFTLGVYDNLVFKRWFRLFTTAVIAGVMLASSTTTAMPAATTGAEEQLLPEEYLAAPSPSATDLQVMISTDWAAADLSSLSHLCSSPSEQQTWSVDISLPTPSLPHSFLLGEVVLKRV